MLVTKNLKVLKTFSHKKMFSKKNLSQKILVTKNVKSQKIFDQKKILSKKKI